MEGFAITAPALAAAAAGIYVGETIGRVLAAPLGKEAQNKFGTDCGRQLGRVACQATAYSTCAVGNVAAKLYIGLRTHGILREPYSWQKPHIVV